MPQSGFTLLPLNETRQLFIDDHSRSGTAVINCSKVHKPGSHHCTPNYMIEHWNCFVDKRRMSALPAKNQFCNIKII